MSSAVYWFHILIYSLGMGVFIVILYFILAATFPFWEDRERRRIQKMQGEILDKDHTNE